MTIEMLNLKLKCLAALIKSYEDWMTRCGVSEVVDNEITRLEGLLDEFEMRSCRLVFVY